MLGERVQMEVGPIDIVQGQEYEDIISVSFTAPAEATSTTKEEAWMDEEEKKTATALLDQTADQAIQGPNEQTMSKEDLQSDSFRMFSFKVVQCKNQDDGHDWTECPFAHAGEKANRRDPRIHQYTGVSCPDYRKGACKRGSACPYAHGVFEVWLHPSRYRTQLCKDASSCTRQVCFFAHSAEELRHVEPEDLPVLDAASADSSSEAAAPPSVLSDSSSDDGSTATAKSGSKASVSTAALKAAAKAAASKQQQKVAAAAASNSSAVQRDWAAAATLSDAKFMSRQGSNASSSQLTAAGLESLQSSLSNASMLSSLTASPSPHPQLGMLPYAMGAQANGASGANRMLRVPLDIALEAAALKASAASAGLQCDTFGSLDLGSGLGCSSPPLAAQWKQQQLPSDPVAMVNSLTAANQWNPLLAAPQLGGPAADAAMTAAAAAAAATAAATTNNSLEVLKQLGGLNGSSSVLAAALAAQQVVAAQHQELMQVVLQQQRQQQQQQRDAMWTAAYTAAVDTGLEPVAAAACANAAVQNTMTGTVAALPPINSSQQPPMPSGNMIQQLQLQLLLQQAQQQQVALKAAAFPSCEPGLPAGGFPNLPPQVVNGLLQPQQQTLLGGPSTCQAGLGFADEMLSTMFAKQLAPGLHGGDLSCVGGSFASMPLSVADGAAGFM